MLLEHHSVYTAGKRTRPADRPTDGTPVVDVDRGGLITWHGPGQLVGYPIIGLAAPIDVVDFVRRLEEALIRVVAELGVPDPGRVPGRTGVWVPADGLRPERKVAAIGLRVQGGVSLHGFAINCNPDLAEFDKIVPCGITDAGVTSLTVELGRDGHRGRAAGTHRRRGGRRPGRPPPGRRAPDHPRRVPHRAGPPPPPLPELEPIHPRRARRCGDQQGYLITTTSCSTAMRDTGGQSSGRRRAWPIASWWCWARPARRRPAPATTTATCCGGTARACCSIPGEGTQRQLLLAGVSSSAITRICLTHFHGDHCLGVPGVARPDVAGPGRAPGDRALPGFGVAVVRTAAARQRVPEIPSTCTSAATPPTGWWRPAETGALSVRRLEHRIETFGYRWDEPDGRRMLPERLAARGITGPAVGRLQRDGRAGRARCGWPTSAPRGPGSRSRS